MDAMDIVASALVAMPARAGRVTKLAGGQGKARREQRRLRAVCARARILRVSGGENERHVGRGSTRHAQGAWRHAALLRRGRPLGRRRDLDYASSSRAMRARLPSRPRARRDDAHLLSIEDVSADQLREQSLDACGWAELCGLAEYASTRLGVEAAMTSTSVGRPVGE